METDIELLCGEYSSLGSVMDADDQSEIDWEKLESELVVDCEWTPEAAAAITMLVRHYGSFVLRNAHALAVVCNYEDGDCGI